jgi:hypothetical protein
MLEDILEVPMGMNNAHNDNVLLSEPVEDDVAFVGVCTDIWPKVLAASTNFRVRRKKLQPLLEILIISPSLRFAEFGNALVKNPLNVVTRSPSEAIRHLRFDLPGFL